MLTVTQMFPGSSVSVLAPWLGGDPPCNPSIAQGPKGYAALVTCRDLRRPVDGWGHTFADDSGTIRTRNWFSALDPNTLEAIHWHELDGPDVPVLYPLVRGIEDPRLYWQGDEWRYSGSIREHHPSGDHRVARCNLGGLIDIMDGEGWVKNQMPTGGQPEFIDAMAIRPELHGGAVVACEGGYLGIVHDVSGRRYTHRFVAFDSAGVVTGGSEPFTFGGKVIEFAAGIVFHKGNVVVSYGVQDQQALLAHIPAKGVQESLR